MISATTMTFGNDIDNSPVAKHVNVVFDNGPKMVSLSVDNSAGKMVHMARADIRLLFSHATLGRNDKPRVEDVTSQVFGVGEYDIVRGDIENMDRAMKWLQMSRWGFHSL